MVSSSYIVLYRPTSWFNRKTEKGKIVGKTDPTNCLMTKTVLFRNHHMNKSQ